MSSERSTEVAKGNSVVPHAAEWSDPSWAWRVDLKVNRLDPEFGYLDGCSAGVVAGKAFLKASQQAGPISLQHVIFDLLDLDAFGEERFAAGDFRRGQIVGFCEELSGFLAFALARSTVPATSEQQLKLDLAQAVNGVEGRALRAKLQRQASERARHAANCRWAQVRAAKALVAMRRDP